MFNAGVALMKIWHIGIAMASRGVVFCIRETWRRRSNVQAKVSVSVGVG